VYGMGYITNSASLPVLAGKVLSLSLSLSLSPSPIMVWHSNLP